jgi:hypothetical protein
MADKVVKAAASAARKGAQRIYFPNRIIQFMSNQEKTVRGLCVRARGTRRLHKIVATLTHTLAKMQPVASTTL